MLPDALRVIRSGALNPALNMALDTALLESGGPPTLRLYGWSPAGLSLGRFQAATAFLDVAGDHVLVRRQTGGGAIYHLDEVTFALTLGAERLPLGVPESYGLLHAAVRRALASVGVSADPPSGGAAAPAARSRHAWCFAVPSRHDLLTPDGRKIVGSAQRRIRRPHPRLLHHGSIVLRAAPATPFCGAVADQVDADVVRADLEAALAAELAACLGLSPRESALSAAESARAARLAGSHCVPRAVSPARP